MAKRKLTQNQTRRIQSNNAKALHRHKKKDIEWSDEMLGESQEGVVVTRYSIHADVENEQGVPCRVWWWEIKLFGVKAMNNYKV